jgi:Na+-transporting NADH:ubiquinone oxidoreductase subunit F
MINFTAILIMFGIAGILGILLVLADHFFSNYGKCKITINNEMEFIVDGGNSLLSGLFDNKIFIPSACGGKATCGFCKMIVAEGGGQVLPTELPFLTRADISKNVRLACQVKVKSDIKVIIPNEYLAINEFIAEIIDIEKLNYDTKEITLRLIEPKTASFRPGQYIQFRVPNTSEYRAYSIASVPSEKDTIRLIVRLVLGGVCSTYIHQSLNIGDKISFTGPFGEFYLHEDSTNDIICIAGGCGMAPFRSIIYHLLEIGSTRNITFYFGARSKRDLYYIDEFYKLSEMHPNFKFIMALSEPEEDKWVGEVGFIHQIVDKYTDNGENKEAYLCGPPPMIDATIDILLSKGFKKENIYFDKFS